jgi:hypothetical protein
VRSESEFIFVRRVRRKGHIVHGALSRGNPVEKSGSDSGEKEVMWEKALESGWGRKVLVQTQKVVEVSGSASPMPENE